MQKKLVLAEKPSVAQSIAKVLRANKRNDGFPISSAALGKQLAEDGFIDQRSEKGTTQSIRFYGRNRRVMILRKDRVQTLMGV